MLIFLALIILALAMFGHASLLIGWVNRIHSTGLRRWLVKSLSLPLLPLVPLAPLLLLTWNDLTSSLRILLSDTPTSSSLSLESLAELSFWTTTFGPTPLRSIAVLYVLFCAVVAIPILGFTVYHRRRKRLPKCVVYSRHIDCDTVAAIGHVPAAGRLAQWVTAIPGNQIFRLRLEERHIRCPRLSTELDGLSIVQITDLHMTGRVTPDYFHQVVRQANAWQPDIIAITGDLVDEAECTEPLLEIFAGLRAPHGIYFVLGNHDFRCGDLPRFRQQLEQAGLIDLGGKCHHLSIKNCDILLAGNELPWLPPAADMSALPARPDQLRVLLSHSPDQFRWAQQHRFDLMLAGHTHGGQICFPLIGPTLCPSWYGTRYAEGDFAAGGTYMHVSRGVSGELPLRWNCPPELSKIVLRAGS